MEKVLVDNKNKNNIVVWNGLNNKDIVLTLRQGAELKPLGKSADKPTIELRSKTTKVDGGKIITTKDLTFTTKSSMTNFIEGCQYSGQRWCEAHLGIPNSKGTSATTTTPTSEPKDTPIIENVDKCEKVEKVEKVDPIEQERERARMTQELAMSIITFCKDFAFTPDPRQLNSLLYESKPEQFIVDSMELVGFDPEMLNLAKAKLSSREFQSLLKQVKKLKPTRTRFNQRLEIKYGPAGTGKTTSAMRENPNAHKIVASASADPDDLFTQFNPESGKYELTTLGQAMVDGKAIIIDEANLYNNVVLERLQGATDETETIFDRGIEIKIAKGFKVVITMNLETNFGKHPLPTPLVSRASRIENFGNMVNLSWVW